MITITDVINKLVAIRYEFGEIPVCLSEPHDYWGSIESYITDDNIMVSDNAKPNGPKSNEVVQAVIFKS
jgi:hypothetical protein